MLINQYTFLSMDRHACAHTHAYIHGHTWLTNGIFEAIKVSCKHMKANQLVREVYYQGFNTDLEGALRRQQV